VRVIAGKFRSRQLATFSGSGIRPTSDRLRETLFDVLAVQRPLEGTRWLDLFAGTGAVGIEALSRGAREVYFVEAARNAAALICKNLESLRISEGAHVITAKTIPGLHKLAASPTPLRFDFCFVDPPYEMKDQYALVLDELSASPLLAPDAIAVAEHSKHFDLAAKFGRLERYRRLQQGDAVLSFYQLS
jgi:16S rRNA (guanine966-N2)-methyltransferase